MAPKDRENGTIMKIFRKIYKTLEEFPGHRGPKNTKPKNIKLEKNAQKHHFACLLPEQIAHKGHKKLLCQAEDLYQF